MGIFAYQFNSDSSKNKIISENDSLSLVAPYRIVNIGNSQSVQLMEFIKTIEEILGKKAIYNFLPMQQRCKGNLG